MNKEERSTVRGETLVSLSSDSYEISVRVLFLNHKSMSGREPENRWGINTE